ncbi:MAG: glycine cleavage system aminomethyltransferase GcvT [Deferrisomatales bacterium]
MPELRRTPLHDCHRALGAHLVEFAGWEMPLQYPDGILKEHLATRRGAGLFDVSHMGRVEVGGADALAFLQHVTSNNAAGLDPDEGQYTFLPTETGGAVDDAYLYRFARSGYRLVVNAANRERDLAHLAAHRAHFGDVELADRTAETAMLALQGPASRGILGGLLTAGRLPDPMRNQLSAAVVAGVAVEVSRTGYTGEPLGFELFCAAADGPPLWDALVAAGATPCGLGARDTLRLEAGLPLYGHELGRDPAGREIPLFALPLAVVAVSFAPLKGRYVGREALLPQRQAFERIAYRDYSLRADLPRLVQPVALLGAGVARAGDRVLRGGRPVGWVTSGTRVPHWVFDADGLEGVPTGEHRLRSICLAYLDCDLVWDDRVEVEVRGKPVPAVVVEYHLRGEAPPFARPIVHGHEPPGERVPAGETPALVLSLLRKTVSNHRWRQEECVNLIPSEMTPSPLVRLASVADPAFRYAEHKEVEAFYETDVFYYQGTDFIRQVEHALQAELRKYLACREVEARLLSGQMANAAVFSALVEYSNRADPKREPRRLRQVVNHHILWGGHLSAQPMGALRDFVARDPRTDRPAVEELPVRADNPYQIDVPAALELVDRLRPELIVLGKSLVLHREPVAPLRRFLDEQKIGAVLMYDMAHVLGLAGPHFQEPFQEGADLVTGSTHKTFFGTQRGLVASRFEEHEERWELWEALQRRAFPGSVSNHHLGTLLGLLVAAYEMNHFKDEYQPAVLRNAVAFARALADCGLGVEGDPSIGFTETHQVVVRVGYGRGPEVAARLEAGNILCNYQALPDEEGFTAAGGIRMGVAEMTRFGMGEADFAELAQLVRDCVVDRADVKGRVRALRSRFQTLNYCFRGPAFEGVLGELRGLVT